MLQRSAQVGSQLWVQLDRADAGWDSACLSADEKAGDIYKQNAKATALMEECIEEVQRQS